jgi:hypothetical protein
MKLIFIVLQLAPKTETSTEKTKAATAQDGAPNTTASDTTPPAAGDAPKGDVNEWDEAEKAEGVEMTAAMIDFKTWAEGEQKVYKFRGFQGFKGNKGETVDGVLLEDRNGVMHITGAAVVVQSCRNAAGLADGHFVKLQFLGMEQGKSGQYFNIKVFRF